MARQGIYQKLERSLIKSFVYICEGLVLVHRHFMKPQNVVYNIFSELTLKASLLFFRKKINENCNRKILRDNEKLNLNFVENLQRQFSDFSNLETILNRKLCVIFETENQTLRINVVLIFFSS